MKSRIIIPTLLACCGLAISGCATEPSGIFKIFDVDEKHQSVATGARHRVIITRKPLLHSRPGLVAPNSIVCAEPSPDVATAISTSFGAGVSVLGQGSGSISGQTVQGLAQLAERTASIQLMRDQMYRACEAYANGAITGTNYSLLMNQINATMVTLLLGETAGGAFGRSLAAIGGKASASASASMAGMPGAMNDIRQNTKQLADAELKVTAAETKVADLKAKAAAGEKNADKVTAAEQELARAKAERDALKELLTSKIDTASEAAGEISKLVAGGGIDAKPDAAVAAQLAEIQRNFIQRSPSYALVDACLVELGMWNVAPGVSELFEPSALALVNKDGLNPHTVSGLVIAASKRERTGLFEFCRTHLATMAPEIYRADAAIRLERVNLERRALDLRWIEARANAISGFATALAQCDRIADAGSKASCKAAVLDLKGREGIEPSDQSQAMLAILRRGVGKLIFPTSSYDRAKDSWSAASARLAELGGLMLAEIPDEVVDEARKQREAERDRLIEKRTGLAADVRKTINSANQFIDAGDTKRPPLAAMQRGQTDLASSVDREANPYKRAIDLAQLQKVQAEALLEVNRYDNQALALNSRVSEMDALISDFKQFGLK